MILNYLRTMHQLRDVIDPPSPTPTPEPGRPQKITCEFCECELGKSGEYKSLSDTAKKFRAMKEINAELEKTIGELRGEIGNLNSKIQQLSPPVPAPGPGGARHGVII